MVCFVGVLRGVLGILVVMGVGMGKGMGMGMGGDWCG